jgi:hypothetical protein
MDSRHAPDAANPPSLAQNGRSDRAHNVSCHHFAHPNHNSYAVNLPPSGYKADRRYEDSTRREWTSPNRGFHGVIGAVPPCDITGIENAAETLRPCFPRNCRSRKFCGTVVSPAVPPNRGHQRHPPGVGILDSRDYQRPRENDETVAVHRS